MYINSSKFLFNLKDFFRTFEKEYIKKYQHLYKDLEQNKEKFYSESLFSEFHIEEASQLNNCPENDKIEYLKREIADFNWIKGKMEEFLAARINIGLSDIPTDDTYYSFNDEKEMKEVFERCIDYLEKNLETFTLTHKPKQSEVKLDNKNNVKDTLENPYPRIFKNTDSFLFFKSLKENVRERYKLADYSFIYRRMQYDEYIYKDIDDSEFRDFLHRINIEIDKTKLLDYCKTDLKESNYISKKGLFPHL